VPFTLDVLNYTGQ